MLSKLNMPVNEKSAAAMRTLIANHPSMTLEQAAFLVSNKLTDDSALLKAALTLLSEGTKTDALLDKLIALLGKQVPGEAMAQDKAPATQTPGAQTPVTQTPGAANAQGSPLAQLIAQIIDNTSPGAAQYEAALKNNKAIITQSGTILQSANDINNEKFLLKDTLLQQNSTINAQSAEKNMQMSGEKLQAGVLGAQTGGADTQAAAASQQSSVWATLAAAQSSAAEIQGQSGNQQQTMAAPLAAALAELPEFRGTPPQALERFSSMLMNVAADNPGSLTGGDSGKLTSLLDKLFTRINANDNSAGERLMQAKQELFARLSLIEETISRSATPAKAELMDQANKLVNHVRLLNSIEQFVYMQLPIVLAEEKQAVELYLFKRKGGRKPDPDDVNILLSLDLENMGHCEAFLNIKNKDISVRMKVDGPAEKDFLYENTVLLHNMLEEAGFNLTETDITYTEDNTTLLTALLAPTKFANGTGGGVDFYH
jgi:hypothetical protein